MKKSIMGMRLAFVVLAALLALPLAPNASLVEAKKRPRTVTRTYRNAERILLPVADFEPRPALPYPSPVRVNGLKGKIRDVNVRLIDLTHAWPSDIEMLLVGPDGQTATVMARVGEGADVSDATLTLDDEAEAPLPVAAPLQSGRFRPTNGAGGAIAFLAPAPAASAQAALSVFDGTDPNGTWRLFVQDRFKTDTGVFDGGWELEITAKGKAKNKR